MVTDEKFEQLDIKDHKLNFTFFPPANEVAGRFLVMFVSHYVHGGEGTHVTISNEALDVTV